MDRIIEQNALDLKAAKENNMSQAMQDRLLLNSSRIKAIANSVLDIVSLDDPVGVIDGGSVRPNG
ncbi:MAG: gamma-glutamyl-phosphate reductase, partial [Oscillospiraceae bacterium]